MVHSYRCPYSKHIKGNLVPCGVCPVCLTKKRNQWVTRLQWQSIDAPLNNLFITLTYADEYLPRSFPSHHPDLSPDHLTSFIKNLRYDNDSSFKYYAVGEYGHLSGRPHYHLSLFGASPYSGCSFGYIPSTACPDNCSSCVVASIRKRWDYGLSQAIPTTPATIGYICKHHVIGHKPPFKDNRRAFCRMSKGLGAPFFDNQVLSSYHYSLGLVSHTYTPTGLPTAMPRYYRDHLFSEADRKGLIPTMPLPTSLERGDALNFIYEFNRKSFLKNGKV